jgi:hypothetical protein
MVEKSKPVANERTGRLSVSVFKNIGRVSKKPYTSIVVQTGRPPISEGEPWRNQRITVFPNQVNDLIDLLQKIKPKIPVDSAS